VAKIVYDYTIHDKHLKALEKKCELCHYLPPELKQKLASEKRNRPARIGSGRKPRGKA